MEEMDLKGRKKLVNEPLEQYYLGDNAWERFSAFYTDMPDTILASQLVASLNGDF